MGKLGGREVHAEIHGPNDVRGDAELIAIAAHLVQSGTRVYRWPLGGGPASFADP